MTIIAAAVGPDGTWIGSDGMQVVNDVIVQHDKKKWYVSKSRKWALAACGESTPQSVLALEQPDLWPPEHVPEWTGREGALSIGQWARETLLATPEFSLVRDKDSSWGDYGFSPLIAATGGVWHLNSDLRTLSDAIDGYFVVAGPGEDFAHGACHRLLLMGLLSAEELVRAAIEAACYHSVWCGGETYVERLDS